MNPLEHNLSELRRVRPSPALDRRIERLLAAADVRRPWGLRRDIPLWACVVLCLVSAAIGFAVRPTPSPSMPEIPVEVDVEVAVTPALERLLVAPARSDDSFFSARYASLEIPASPVRGGPPADSSTP
jgi:hypothetical protein